MPRRWASACGGRGLQASRSYSSAASVAVIGGVSASATRASARAAISSAERRPTKVPASAISACGRSGRQPLQQRSARRRAPGRARRTGPAAPGTARAARRGAAARPCAGRVVSSPRTAAIRMPMSPVAGRRFRPASRSAEQGEHLGIRRLGGGAVEDLIPHLQVFAAPGPSAVLLAEHLAQIGIARRVRPVRHVRLHHRHGEVGAQHHLAPERVMRDIGPRADILAVKVQQGLGGLQDIGLDRHRARRAERRANRRSASARIAALWIGHCAQHLSHGGHQIGPRHLDLRGAVLPFLQRGAFGDLRAQDQVLQDDGALAQPRSRPGSPQSATARLSAYFNWLPKFFGLPR